MAGDSPHPLDEPLPLSEGPELGKDLGKESKGKEPRKSAGGMSRLRNLTGKGSGSGWERGTSTTPTSVGVVPKKPGIPPQFVCQLTFAAAGDNFGDFVQVSIN